MQFLVSIRLYEPTRPANCVTPVIDRAALLPQAHPLKGYDALHLATGLEAARNLADQKIAPVFVSGDAQMLRAAGAEGLATDNPFLHVDMDG